MKHINFRSECFFSNDNTKKINLIRLISNEVQRELDVVEGRIFLKIYYFGVFLGSSCVSQSLLMRGEQNFESGFNTDLLKNRTKIF